MHHDLSIELETEINESVILYLADKYFYGTSPVTLEERFALSVEKCASEQAKEAHNQRYQQAKRVEAMIEKAVGNARDP